ncbi:MAG: TraB/GumN family protein [Clostridiales bacterium]|jgi:uncharacterized protein YbaP (TraB family)|nr:TraB/GumN family protein [Clostridiales bacterium]
MNNNILKRKPIFVALVVLLAVSVLSGCVSKLAVDAPALWRVTSPEGQVMYLFGTIHMATDDLYPLPGYITGAFDDSGYLAVEANVLGATDPSGIADMDMSALMYTDGRSAVDDIGEELFGRTMEALAEFTGLSNAELAAFGMFKPFMLAIQLEGLLLMETGMQMNAGVDMYFLQEAVDRDMEILETESVTMQLDMLGGFSIPLQIAYLEMTLEALDEMETSQEELSVEDYALYTAWRQGDLAALEELIAEGTMPFDDAELNEEYYDALITYRNIGMADKAEEYMADGKTVFFTAGAAHMAGDGGIADLLTERGYDVERMN